jgi:general secretion pathway protein B
MSLILDALRKMEQDRNARRGAAQDIRPEVLRYRGASAPQRPRSYLPVALGVVLLACGIGAGFFFMGHRSAQVSEQVTPAPGAVPVQPASGDPGMPGAAIAPVTPQPPVPAIATPAASPQVAPRAAGAPAAGAPGGQPVRQPVAEAIPARTEPVRAVQPKPVPREAAAVPQPAPADISITGIAWQDERSLRRAVVNGSLVGEGAEVAGARVVEIREDRVRLTRGGQVFDAVISAGGR